MERRKWEWSGEEEKREEKRGEWRKGKIIKRRGEKEQRKEKRGEKNRRGVQKRKEIEVVREGGQEGGNYLGKESSGCDNYKNFTYR